MKIRFPRTTVDAHSVAQQKPQGFLRRALAALVVTSVLASGSVLLTPSASWADEGQPDETTVVEQATTEPTPEPIQVPTPTPEQPAPEPTPTPDEISTDAPAENPATAEEEPEQFGKDALESDDQAPLTEEQNIGAAEALSGIQGSDLLQTTSESSNPLSDYYLLNPPTVTPLASHTARATFPAFDFAANPASDAQSARYTVTAYWTDDEGIERSKTASVMHYPHLQNFQPQVNVTGLTPGESYQYTLTLTIALSDWVTEVSSGESARSAAIAQPEPSIPGKAPTPDVRVLSSTQVEVVWPSLDTALNITYLVRAYQVVGDDLVQVSVSSALDPFVHGTSYTVSNLVGNTDYRFSVTAQTLDGAGPESDFSRLVTTEFGQALAPGAVTLARDSNNIEYWLDVSWTAPAADGGYPITGYLVEVFAAAATNNTNSIAARIEVPASTTNFRFEDLAYGTTSWSARVATLTSAGQSQSWAVSSSLSFPTRSDGSYANRVGSAPTLSNLTDDSVTVNWNAPTINGSNPAPAGYLLKVTQKNPDVTTGNSFFVKVIDVGNPSVHSWVIDELEGYSRYHVSVIAYDFDENGGKLYRQASALSTNTNWGSADTSATRQTTGTRVPWVSTISRPATPVADNPNQLTWTGSAITSAHGSGGTPVTAYRVDLYEAGHHEDAGRIRSEIVEVEPDEPPTVTFSGLKIGASYTIRYHAINTVGESQTVSTFTLPVILPAEWQPGGRAPLYADIPELEAAITARDVLKLTGDQVGLGDPFEVGLQKRARFDWPGIETEGEIWIYDAAHYNSSYTVSSAGKVSHIIDTAELNAGTFFAVFYPASFIASGGPGSGDKPVAFEFTVTASDMGRTDVDNAIFRWGMNNETNNGAYFGGCNFLAAGKSPDVGGAVVFTPDRYSAQEGNVRVEKPNAAGEWELATWDSKCLDRYGNVLKSGTATGYGENQVIIENGEGWIDPSTNSAEITWNGDFSVVYYGGLTYWYVSNPVLTIVDGIGTITAIADGFGADMDDLSKWEPLTPTTITLAVIGTPEKPLRVSSIGLDVIPEYLGVEIDDAGGRNPQDKTGSAWGSFPQDFVDFQMLTGQSAYWYSSGGVADGAKPTTKLYIRYLDGIYDTIDMDDPDEGSGNVIDQPDVDAPPTQRPLRVNLQASVTETSVDSLEALLQMIQDELITLLSAEEAGTNPTFRIGDRIDLQFAWSGEDTEGVVWIYPEVLYAGSFSVVDGQVTIALDSSVFETEGTKYLTFFGDAGTVLAVMLEADGFAPVIERTAVDGSQGAIPISGGGADISGTGGMSQTEILLLSIVIGGGIIVLGSAGAATMLFTRRRGLL